MIETRYAFNVTTHAASIEYWDNETEQKLSEWRLSDRTIYAPAKLTTDEVPLEEALAADGIATAWQQFITSRFKPARFPVSRYHCDLRKRANSVRIIFKREDVEIIDDTWSNATGLVTFGQRPEVTWPWADYVVWRKCSERFLQACVNFAKTE